MNWNTTELATGITELLMWMVHTIPLLLLFLTFFRLIIEIQHLFFHQNLAYEIILTLGQAFEVAYQLALQARKGAHGPPTMQDSLESKAGKPIPKPRASIRKSVVRA